MYSFLDMNLQTVISTGPHALVQTLSQNQDPKFQICGGASEGRVEGSRVIQAIASMVKARDDDPSNLEVLLALGVSHTNDIVLNAKEALQICIGCPVSIWRNQMARCALGTSETI
jgi:acyl-CoA hydrolase